MVTINEPAKQTMALPALPGTGKGGVPLDMAWHPVKHGSLRRIDSERNLSLTRSGAAFRALDQHQIQRPRTAMALRPSDRSSVSTRSTPDRDLDTTSQSSLSPALLHQESFGRASPDWLSVSNPNTTPSVKSHSGSSIMSSHTVDDDSASELSSDDSLSEPDSWPGLDDNPAVTKVWSKSFHQAMDREMIQLWVQYNRDWDALIQKCTGGPNSNSPRVGESTGWAQNTTSSSHHAPPGQGLRLPTRHPIDEEDEDDELEKHRPNSSQSKNSSSAPKRFACPFRKHNPRVYNIKEHEVCAVKDWPTISRLKEHLYRRHYKIHCPRCKVIFNDARGLASHEMLPLGCEVIDAVPPGDITAAQEKQLKSRSRKHAARRQTDEEKWEDIYRLLFQVPLEESVPSPYPEFVEDLGPISPESKNKLGLQHFLLTEMPQFFRQTAEAYAGRQIQAHEVVRMEDIPKLIEESLKRAFKAWEDRLSNSAPQASPTSSFVTSEVTAPSPNLWRDTPRTNPYMQGQATYIGGVEPAITPGYNWIPPPDLSHLNTLFPVSDPNDSGFGDGNYLPTSSGDSYANFDAAIGGTLMGDGGSDMSTANWGSF
ncbi:hypothetical protein B0H63DRAFT_394247 [Podospora didyma]|uniref:C2H2-type domain-containing protein n=1 Tax=Podospora didyma TaxID=330526 RepID=A0AAE0NPW7_9PEZI|nr:hypothetical protein B0H63DRAFT_394247 [Podospora didyma]